MKAITVLENLYKEERKEAIENAEARGFKSHGFESGEEMLDFLEIDGDVEHTIFDSGFLAGIEYAIRHLSSIKNK